MRNPIVTLLGTALVFFSNLALATEAIDSINDPVLQNWIHQIVQVPATNKPICRIEYTHSAERNFAVTGSPEHFQFYNSCSGQTFRVDDPDYKVGSLLRRLKHPTLESYQKAEDSQIFRALKYQPDFVNKVQNEIVNQLQVHQGYVFLNGMDDNQNLFPYFSIERTYYVFVKSSDQE